MPVVFKIELGGKNYLQDDTGRRLLLPSEEACRERLSTMLEKFKSPDHPMIKQFWNERAMAMTNQNPLEAEYNTELFVMLDRIWEGLTEPQETIDVFASYKE